MGKEIDISSIQNARIRELATQIDKKYEDDERFSGDGNGKINSAFEFSALRGEVVLYEKGQPCTLKEEDDINELKQLLGFEGSAQPKPAVKTDNQAAAEKPVTSPIAVGPAPQGVSKNDLDKYEKAVKNKIEELSKKATSNAELMNLLNRSVTNGDYEYAKQQAMQIIALVEATNYNSKDDIKKVKDNVKKQLGGKLTGFQKTVLDKAVDMAKLSQIRKEAYQMLDVYNAERAKDGENGQNYDKYLEAVKKKYKDDGKWGKSYSKDAFKELENYVKEAIREELEGGLAARTEKDGKAMRKAWKKEVSSKMARDVIDDMEIDTNSKGRENKIKDVSKVTKDQLVKAVGYDTFEKLNMFYLDPQQGHVNEDGTYNLTDLKDAVLKNIGADFKLSREDKDKQMAEFQKIKAKLETVTRQKLSNTDVKDIVHKLFNIDIEGRDRSAKYIANSALGGLPGALGAAVGAFIGAYASPHSRLNIHNSAHAKIDLELKGVTEAQVQDLIDYFKESGYNGTVSKISGGVKINIDAEAIQNIYKNNGVDNGIFAAVPAAVLSVLVSALTALILGGDRTETSCISVSDYDKDDEMYTDPNKFKAYILNTTENSKKAAKMCKVVDKYVAAYGDKWHEEFWNDLREDAGYGSRMNPDECHMFLTYRNPVKKETPKPEQKPEPKPEDKYFQTMVCEKEETENFDIDVRKIDGTHTGWAQIVKGYEGCWDGVLAQRPLRAIKVIQAITDGDYSAARLKELVNKTLQVGNNAAKLRAEMGDISGFDVEIYIQVLQANMPGKEVKVPTITNEDNTTCEWRQVPLKVRYRGPKAKGGVQSPSAKDRGSKTSRSFNGQVTADGVTSNYNNRNDYTIAVNGYKAKGYTEKHRKCDYKD